METEIEVNDSDFDEKVIERSKETPIIVDFWAEWCGPCKMLGPVLGSIAAEYGRKFILAKVDVDKNKQKAQEYEVRSIPTVKMFKNGVIVDEFIGATSKEQAEKWINKNLE